MFLRLRYRLEYAFYVLGKTLFRVLPHSPRLFLGRLLGTSAFWVDRRHRKVALDNLLLAYPDSDERQRLDIAKRCFRSFGQLLAEVLGASGLDRERTLRRFDVEGWHHIEVAEARNQGMILITGHLGDWEAIPQYLALTGRPMSFVARPLDNPLMEEDLRRIRERFGSRSIAKRKAARGVLRVLRAKGRAGILIDQRVHPNEGKKYPFFGRPAYTTSMPARVSMRTGAPVIPIFSIPHEDWRRTRIVIRPPIYPDQVRGDSESRIDALTVRYLEAIEEMIREHPYLWLWMHRRWRQYPDWPYNGRGNRQNGKAQTSESRSSNQALP